MCRGYKSMRHDLQIKDDYHAVHLELDRAESSLTAE